MMLWLLLPLRLPPHHGYDHSSVTTTPWLRPFLCDYHTTATTTALWLPHHSYDHCSVTTTPRLRPLLCYYHIVPTITTNHHQNRCSITTPVTAMITTTIAVSFITITMDRLCFHHYYFYYYHYCYYHYCCYYKNYYDHYHYHCCQYAGMANASIITSMQHRLLYFQKDVARANPQVILGLSGNTSSSGSLLWVIAFLLLLHRFRQSSCHGSELWGSHSAGFASPCQWQMLLQPTPSGPFCPLKWTDNSASMKYHVLNRWHCVKCHQQLSHGAAGLRLIQTVGG